MTAVARPRKTKAIVFGAVALAFSAVIVTAAGYWWHEHNRPSQASKADCVLAQQLVDSTRQIPSDKAAVDKWEKSAQQRRYQLKDGYLGASISNYEGLAAQNARGEGAPSVKEVRHLQDQASGHCVDANVKLSFPSISS
ncbi:hypothetical protein ACFOZ0_29890 [Streptomyces yaanensis]|uniref:Secreted protein n=1 Tax=Streptomyces yaanensis TaxID=1142239 RepID=A0ABV7SKD1_9ACTN|nr:hypothetical protein [Streptomyces sp. CGMCC 4.7035]WNC00449.1 hypothetical protein Q2K21_21630 [Streptomyces sp. CGMCC 4.7035]